jgi:uncharacterized protein
MIGLVTGSFSGAFGIGGGTVSTPLLRLILHIDPHVAVGTTMALIIPTAISASWNYYRKKEIDFSMCRIMVLPAVLGVCVGAFSTQFIHGLHLMLAFAGFVCIAGLDLTFGVVQKLLKDSEEDARVSAILEDEKTETEVIRSLVQKGLDRERSLIILGLFAGLTAGFFGVGAGFIFVPCLMYLFKTPIKTAFGTSLLVVSAIAIPGTMTHLAIGHVDFPLMLSMMGGSIPGSFLGSTVALKLKDSWLRRGFGVAMLCVAAALASNELLR